MTRTLLTQADLDRIALALDHARALAAFGIGIFLARPALDADGKWDPTGGHNGCGYWLPKNWQYTMADRAVLDQWQPGMAVCAVMGCGLDGLDFDPRHGGDETRAGLQAAGLCPTCYGEASTPSEGSHLFVRSMDVHSLDALRPGLDVKAGGSDGEGRGCMFIAPTVRKSKADGQIRAYRWISPPDLDRLREDGPDDDSGAAIAGMVRDARAGRKNGATNGATNGDAGGTSSAGGMFGGPSPWDDIPGTLAAGRNKGVFDLASALRGRGGWQLADAVEYMQVRVWPEIDQSQGGHPFPEHEFKSTIAGVFGRYPDGPSGNGRAYGAATDPPGAPREGPRVTASPGPTPRPDPLAGLWDRRKEFGVIHQWAQAGMVNPGAVLVAVIGRVLATVPPWVVLPPLIGGRPGGSLNTFIALAGPSQAGKDGAMDVAADAVRLPVTRWSFCCDDDPYPYSMPLGSGEGLAHQYAHRVRRGATDDPKDTTKVSVVERLRESVIFEVSEVGTLSKNAGRNGSTIMENLCILWTGKTLGQANADPDRRLPVAAHSYRAVLLLGVQPRKAGPLFDGEDGGLPQRMVWGDAIDTAMPLPHLTPEAPEPWSMADQEWHRPRDGGPLVLPVPDVVRDAVRETRYRIGSGREVNSYAGHLMFTREKLAQGLALLNGHRVMTDEDWEISGAIVEQSELVRADVQGEVKAANATGSKIRGIAHGHAEVAARGVIKAAEDAALADQVERVRGRILAAFTDGVSLGRGWLRANRFGRQQNEREAFDAAWLDLVDKGLLVPDKSRWRRP